MEKTFQNAPFYVEISDYGVCFIWELLISENQMKNKFNKNCPAMVANVTVKTLNCARMFKMLHVRAFISHTLLTAYKY